MPLCDRLGITEQSMPINKIDESLTTFLRGTNDKKMVYTFKSFSVSDSNLLAFYCYYLERSEKAKEYASLMLACLKDYYFGNWRTEVPSDDGCINPKVWRECEWVDFFRNGIMWSSCLNKWDATVELATYPGEDCWQDDLYSKEFHVWYLLEAAILRGDSQDKIVQYFSFLEQSNKIREKLLAHILQAILDGDSTKVNTELNTYLKYYKKREFPKPEITEKVSIDGTFLINYARHKGLEVRYSPEYEDHIVKLK